MLRRLLLAAGLLVPSMAFAQAPILATPGTINWGMSATFPPFEFLENGKPVGFDVELSAMLAKKMGLNSEIGQYDFKGIIPAVLGRRIDAIISGMYVNPERSAVVDFLPYMAIGNQLVVRKGNPVGLTDMASMCGHRVAAPVGSAFELAANRAAAACAAGGKPVLTILPLAGTTTAALALSQDRVDAIIVSTATAASLLTATPDAFDMAGAPFEVETRVGIAVAKDNPGLMAALKKAMAEVVADGDYAKLLKKWNMPASSSIF